MKIHRYFKYLAIVYLGLFTIENAKSTSLIFSQTPTVTDLACGVSVVAGTPYRTLSYVVENTTATTVHFGTPKIIINASDDSSYTITNVTVSTTSNCQQVTSPSGYYAIAPQASCTINVGITPPTDGTILCSPGINQTIDRTLYIPVNTTQQSLSSPIQANVTLLGTGADFAVLGHALYNYDSYGATNILGNLGYLKGYTGTFYVSDGNIYTNTDSLAQDAQSDFYTAYTQLLNEPCQTINLAGSALEGPINAGIYCLQDNTATIDIGNTSTATPITLSGSGYFIFIVKANACTGASGAVDCNINVSAGTTFNYVNASPENVFWVLEGSTAELAISDRAIFDGTVLNAGNIGMKPASLTPALVRGRLYSSLTSGQAISFYGNTVTLPKYILP